MAEAQCTREARMSKTILFFYGSLRRGGTNHRLIADQTFLGEAVTAPKYRLLDLGKYTGLIRDDANGVAIPGELWEVTECCLGELDDFEGLDYPRWPLEVEGWAGVQGYLWKDSA